MIQNWMKLILILCWFESVQSNPDARRLYQHIMVGYNRLIRPVANSSEVTRVRMKLRLAQILEVHEKNQIMTTKVWIKQVWNDSNLRWDPRSYAGVRTLYIPANEIWTPDIVLYNNADGKYQISSMTKAAVHYNGTVVWEPPAMYKSMCPIDIKFFPYDEQSCELRFGSWTYDGYEVDLVHYDEHLVNVIPDEKGRMVQWVEQAMDVSDYHPSVQWAVMAVPGQRHELRFNCCDAPYIDITFNITIRRWTLFYTTSLVIPCIGISFLTVTVFYLPSESGEKVGLSISILVCLTMFFLLLVEIIPSTSLVIPLIGKYLLFTMVIVTLSIAVTVITLNLHYRSPNTHRMPIWIKRIVLGILPKLLLMKRPGSTADQTETPVPITRRFPKRYSFVPSMSSQALIPREMSSFSGDTSTSFILPDPAPAYQDTTGRRRQRRGDQWQEDHTFAARAAFRSACFIADYFRRQTEDDDAKEDWHYVAQVMDRLFLWLFCIAFLVGTGCIMLGGTNMTSKYAHPIA